jgi:hypothetical protein
VRVAVERAIGGVSQTFEPGFTLALVEAKEISEGSRAATVGA